MLNSIDINKIKEKILSKNKTISNNELNNILNIILYSENMIHTDINSEYWTIIFSDMMNIISDLTEV